MQFEALALAADEVDVLIGRKPARTHGHQHQLHRHCQHQHSAAESAVEKTDRQVRKVRDAAEKFVHGMASAFRVPCGVAFNEDRSGSDSGEDASAKGMFADDADYSRVLNALAAVRRCATVCVVGVGLHACARVRSMRVLVL